MANPKKTQPILDILLKNQQKLLDFLPKFHHDRTDDEQFNDEKSYLIKQVCADILKIIYHGGIEFVFLAWQIKELKPAEG